MFSKPRISGDEFVFSKVDEEGLLMIGRIVGSKTSLTKCPSTKDNQDCFKFPKSRESVIDTETSLSKEILKC